MLAIYIGDARDVVKRIRSNHCSGNIEGSALRKHIAIKKGYSLTKTRRDSGSIRLRINLLDLRFGEQTISDYLRSGIWKFVFCSSYIEAHDFQWYAIGKLHPLLNVNCKKWDSQQNNRYANLLTALITSPGYTFAQLDAKQVGPGVYLLYHAAWTISPLNQDIFEFQF